MNDTVIAIRLSEVREYGPNAAIVLQQIRHDLHWRNIEWTKITRAELARITGLTTKQCRKATEDLVAAGALEACKPHACKGDQTIAYRAVETEDPPAPRDNVKDDPEGNSSFRDLEEIPPITPLSDNELLPPLRKSDGTDEGKSKPKRSGRKKRNIADRLSNEQMERFAAFWKRFPRKNDRARAINAWESAIDAGVVDQVESALEHYLRSQEDWRERYPDAELPWEYGGVKFIYEGWLNFVDGPDPEAFGQPRHVEIDDDDDWMDRTIQDA